MEKTGKRDGSDIPATQKEFDELLEHYMDRGEEEAIFDLLQKFPDFTRQYAGELEKELGLEQIP